MTARTRIRRKPLDTLERVREEMADAYWRMKGGRVDLDAGKAQVYALGKIVEVLKAEQGLDPELKELLAQLRDMKEGRHGSWRQ